MKIRILFKLCFSLIFFVKTNQIYSQYSDYYRVDINKNVISNVSIRSHITTIDYGQLALANAEMEKIRLEKKKFQNELSKEILEQIANNPIEAFYHGYDDVYNASKEHANSQGFQKFTVVNRIPHESMFVSSGVGAFENISNDGIRTELILYSPRYNVNNEEVDIEETLMFNNAVIGKENEGLGIDGGTAYLHKKDLNRANVYGLNGYRATIIWEDKYQLYISDIYMAFDNSKGNGIIYTFKSRISADRDNASFEKLEGRRYYLLPLIDKVVSTSKIKYEKY